MKLSVTSYRLPVVGIVVVCCLVLSGCVSYEKFDCKVDSDCEVSYDDAYEFEVCVNGKWHDDNPSNLEYQRLRTKGVGCECVDRKCVKKSGM